MDQVKPGKGGLKEMIAARYPLYPIIKGFPRSGNHYFAALVSTNFYGLVGYRLLQPIHVHSLPGRYEQGLKRANTLLLYIHRNFEDTAKSLFTMRYTFGLAVDDFDTFINTKVLDMFSKAQLSQEKAAYHSLGGFHRANKRISGVFEYIDMTLKEYHSLHVRSWKELESKSDNVLLIRYEDLLQDFQNTMLTVGAKLGSDRKVFTNISKKIGWRLAGDDEI